MIRKPLNSHTKSQAKLFVSFFLILVFCLSLGSPIVIAEDRREEINDEIKDLNSNIKSYQSLIAKMANEEKSLADQKIELEKTIESLNQQKEQTKASINENKAKVQEIQTDIEKSEAKEQELKDQLAQILRILYEYKNDSKSSLELLLTERKISEFINRIQSISAIQDNLDDVLDQTQEIKKKQKEIEDQLLAKQKELENLHKMKIQQESETQSLVAYKQTLIDQTQANQSAYSRRIANADKLKKDLADELNMLALSAASGPITFEMAVASAKTVSSQTGVRAALLLGILKQETNFGANTGTATYHNAYRGVSAENRIRLFKQITRELGMDPETTKVSAWPGYGSGGAMGPCQFMPDTWMGYRDEVKQVTGHNTPNPWNLTDCLTAMGLKLKKGGAASQRYQDEWTAALLYFCGSNTPESRAQYAFYPNSVMALATAYQSQI